MRKKRILLVEDEDELRTVLTLGLEEAGYEVLQAGDGEEGFRLAQEKKPDLILSDIMMPKMDGNQLLKKLRASDFGKDVPFIVLTARGKMKEYFELMDVDDFMIKPFEAEALLMRIEKALYRKKIKEDSEGGPRDIQKKVLLLENEEYISSPFQGALERCAHRYKVKVVRTAAECFEAIVLFQPDVIVTRFALEGITSRMLLSIIRGMPQSRNIPIIVYSPNELRGEQREAMQAGASSYIGEINKKKLIDEVYNILHQ